MNTNTNRWKQKHQMFILHTDVTGVCNSSVYSMDILSYISPIFWDDKGFNLLVVYIPDKDSQERRTILINV